MVTNMRRLLHWSLLPIIAATLLFGSVSLIFPFGRDQGIHAFIADSALSGKVVYRDVFNVKPPLTTVVHGLALILFGRTMTAIRLFDLLWTIATSLVLAAFAARAFGNRWVGAVAGVLYPFQYYLFGYWHSAQTDGWLNLPLAAAFLVALSCLEFAEKRERRAWFWVGFLVALAALFKYTVGVALPLIAVFGLIAGHGRFADRFRAALWSVAGCVVAFAGTALALLVSGAMPAFLESQLGLMPSYTRLGPAEGSLVTAFVAPLLANGVLRVLAFTGAVGLLGTAILMAVRRNARPGAVIALLWCLAALVSVVAQGKFFVYHYLPLIAAAAVLAAGLVALAAPALRRLPAMVNVVLGLATAAGLTFAAGYAPQFATLASVARGQPTLREYWDSGEHNSGSDFSLREDLALADYLDATTRPVDRVFIWGYEPLVYFVSRRKMVSRFEYNFPLVVSWHTEQFRAELVHDLTATPPTIFVVAHGDQTPWVMGHDKDSFETLMDFPELRDYVAGHYLPDQRVGRFDAYRFAGD